MFGAIDLGGTKIRALVLDGNGRVRGEHECLTRALDGPAAVLDRMVASLEAARALAGNPTLTAVGVASPGPIDWARGAVTGPPNLPGWDDIPLAALLSARLALPVVLENDANAAAWAELCLGAGQGAANLIYLTISTGIGAGIVVHGHLYRGTSGMAGELGHMPLVPRGPRCGCGSRGCLEALASGTAIARRARTLLGSGRSPLLAAIAAPSATVTAEHVVRAAAAGDPGARAIIRQAGQYLGLGLAAIANIFEPEVIVLGGGVTNAGPMLLNPAERVLRRRALQPARDRVRVVSAALGDRAVALGAMLLARSGPHRG